MKQSRLQVLPRLLPLLVVLAACEPLPAQKVPVVDKELGNGLRLLMVVRRDEPTVAGGWVAHVGSSNERPGVTGIAHLFEHMMFKGTPTIGTKDYQKDLEIINKQEQLRDEMRQEDRKMRAEYRKGEIDDLLKPENKTDRYKQLEKQFNELTNSPVAAEAYRNLGLLYQNAGQPDQAMQYFNQAARVKPTFPEVHHDIGLLYLRKQMPDQAIEQFRTVLQQQPDHGPAILNLAAAYEMKGDIADARQALQGYIQQYGNLNTPYIAQVRERLQGLQ